MIAESQGQVAAQVAQVTAEIERQKARVLQVQRKLDADIVQLAEAERQAREEQARGDAAVVVERGKAEAEALKRVFQAFATAGDGAREVLVLQQVIPLLGQVRQLVGGPDQEPEAERLRRRPGGAVEEHVGGHPQREDQSEAHGHGHGGP